jgi:hypothetical protein
MLNNRRSYPGITTALISTMVHDLAAGGFRVSGNNPWDIDTRLHGIKIRAEWQERSSVLSMTITDRNWYVSHDDVWSAIDTLMKTDPARGTVPGTQPSMP